MSLKDIAFLANWARRNREVVEVVATNLHRLPVHIDGILHHLEKSALKQIEEEERYHLNNIKAVPCSNTEPTKKKG